MSSSCVSVRSVVAIPARNEAARISSCLDALSAQTDQHGMCLPDDMFQVVLLVNNSDDGTAELAREIAPSLPYRLDVLEASLSGEEASAGGARRLAMGEAARRLQSSKICRGIILTTDADTRVHPAWISNIVSAIDAGVDAVTGGLSLDEVEEALLPSVLKRRGALEGRYERLLCELESRLDPKPWDPWPRHACEPGASLALTLESFLAVGGVPPMPLGEDRALCDLLRANGFRIRHALNASVITSGRLVGRATGGCADTMCERIRDPDTRCDPYLEPVWTAIRRFATSGREGFISTKRIGLRPRRLALHIFLAECVLTVLRAKTSGRRGVAEKAPQTEQIA